MRSTDTEKTEETLSDIEVLIPLLKEAVPDISQKELFLIWEKRDTPKVGEILSRLLKTA